MTRKHAALYIVLNLWSKSILDSYSCIYYYWNFFMCFFFFFLLFISKENWAKYASLLMIIMVIHLEKFNLQIKDICIYPFVNFPYFYNDMSIFIYILIKCDCCQELIPENKHFTEILAPYDWCWNFEKCLVVSISENVCGHCKIPIWKMFAGVANFQFGNCWQRCKFPIPKMLSVLQISGIISEEKTSNYAILYPMDASYKLKLCELSHSKLMNPIWKTMLVQVVRVYIKWWQTKRTSQITNIN